MKIEMYKHIYFYNQVWNCMSFLLCMRNWYNKIILYKVKQKRKAKQRRNKKKKWELFFAFFRETLSDYIAQWQWLLNFILFLLGLGFSFVQREFLHNWQMSRFEIKIMINCVVCFFIANVCFNINSRPPHFLSIYLWLISKWESKQHFIKRYFRTIIKVMSEYQSVAV